MNASPVLVTTDLSPESIQAFSFARDEAVRRGSEIVLLSVLDDWNVPMQTYEYTPPEVFFEMKEDLLKQRKKSLESLLEEHFSNCSGSIRVADAAGKSVADEIVRVASEIRASVVVIASHGKGTIRSLLLGSVVERVVRLAHCPILVISLHTAAI
jgi:nucleotide-binding universal stress UspA family protein